MGRFDFFRGKKGKSSAKASKRSNTPAATDLTGNKVASLSDIGTIYTSPDRPAAPPPGPSPQGVRYPQNSAAPRSPQSKKGVNASGKRVTTTTVHVPPPSKTGRPPRAAAAAPTDSSEKTAEDSTTALTRELVKKFIADIWNRGEVDLIPEVCSPSLRFNGNTGFDRVGHDGLARMVGTIRDALDDYHCEIHSMVVENNKAFCRLRFTGRHTGNLLGYEPTNKVVAWMGATEFTCQNGKILKVWELGDVKSLEEQINPDQKSQEEL